MSENRSSLDGATRDKRNLKPHKWAVAAMWLYGQEYASQNGGSMDFWDSLSKYRQAMCRQMVTEIDRASKAKQRP